MMILNRMKLVVPLLLLAMSLAVYLGYVQPLAEENEARYRELDESSAALLTFVKEQRLYPSTAIVEEMTRLEADLDKGLMRLLSPLPMDEDYGDDVDTLFEAWGLGADEAVVSKAKHFQRQLATRAGPGCRESATNLAKSLVMSICRTGITEFEKLGIRLLDHGTDTEEENLRILQVEIAFIAGATESVDFLEDWVFNTGGNFLIQPLSVTIQRKNPGQIEGDLTTFSSPPVLVALEVRLYLNIDKG